MLAEASGGLEERIFLLEVGRGLMPAAADNSDKRKITEQISQRQNIRSISIMNVHIVTSAAISSHSTHTHAHHAKSARTPRSSTAGAGGQTASAQHAHSRVYVTIPRVML